MSATYANITEKVTAKTPDMDMTAKYHLKGEQKTLAVMKRKLHSIPNFMTHLNLELIAGWFWRNIMYAVPAFKQLTLVQRTTSP